MRRQEAQELSIKSALMFSRIQYLDGCMYLEDPDQRDKHMHNFLLLDQPLKDEHILHSYRDGMAQYGWAQFRVEQPGECHALSSYLNHHPHVSQTLLYMAAPRASITLPRSSKRLDLRRVDPFHDDAFFEFIYKEDVAFGEVYAHGNWKRMKTVMQIHSHIEYFTLYDHDMMIGHIGIIYHGHTVEIDEFYILETYQRQGYGTAMMHAIVTRLKEKNIQTVFLEANATDTAQHMYRRWGFNDVGSYRFVRF
jgi:ribosomal protein S18 acetylase RimI-like enzyme